LISHATRKISGWTGAGIQMPYLPRYIPLPVAVTSAGTGKSCTPDPKAWVRIPVPCSWFTMLPMTRLSEPCPSWSLGRSYGHRPTPLWCTVGLQQKDGAAGLRGHRAGAARDGGQGFLERPALFLVAFHKMILWATCPAAVRGRTGRAAPMHLSQVPALVGTVPQKLQSDIQ
jgi:hypothetical protein